MEKSKDIVIEEGRAFFIGFVIAAGLAAIFWLALGVNAQIVSSPIVPTTAVSSVTAKGIVSVFEPDLSKLNISDLQKKYSFDINEKDLLISKYAKLYDSCKNKH